MRVWFCVEACWLAQAACVLLNVSENWKSRPKSCGWVVSSLHYLSLRPGQPQTIRPAPNLLTPGLSRDQDEQNQHKNTSSFLSDTNSIKHIVSFCYQFSFFFLITIQRRCAVQTFMKNYNLRSSGWNPWQVYKWEGKRAFYCLKDKQ